MITHANKLLVVISLILLAFTLPSASAEVCRSCHGSGTGTFACHFCKGSGLQGKMKCHFCNGKGIQKCSACNGTGSARRSQSYHICQSCKGSGTGPFACTHCKGTGFNGSFKCSFCNGRRLQKCSSCNGTGRKR